MKTIFYVGPLAKPGTCRQRLEAIRRLGYKVYTFDTSPIFWALGQPFEGIGRRLKCYDLRGVNRQIVRKAHAISPWLVWVDKGLTISKTTIGTIKAMGAKSVHYSPDDYMNPINQSGKLSSALTAYDLVVTTKSYNVAELEEFGVSRVKFIDNAYDPSSHAPIDEARALLDYRCDIAFIGAYEQERMQSMIYLLEKGYHVTMWTPKWPIGYAKPLKLDLREGYLNEKEYAKVISASKINLAFLRKVNRDLQTTRSIEIPACGGFMLAERTQEHMNLFEEGREAEFFSSDQELVDKVAYYLSHDTERKGIAQNGRARCVNSGYSNDDRISEVLNELDK